MDGSQYPKQYVGYWNTQAAYGFKVFANAIHLDFGLVTNWSERDRSEGPQCAEDYLQDTLND